MSGNTSYTDLDEYLEAGYEIKSAFPEAVRYAFVLQRGRKAAMVYLDGDIDTYPTTEKTIDIGY